MKESYRTGRLYLSLFLVAALVVIGCKSNQNSQSTPTDQSSNQPAADQTQQPGDPANANVVPISNTTTASAPSSGSTASGGSSAPSGSSGESDQYSSDQYNPDDYNQDDGYGEDAEAYAQQPPPQLPEYDQPPCPEDGDIWTPGYWAYAQPSGYYWVPGAWVSAPYQGALWTPPYWGYRDGRYAFYRGYWGRHVGYYGGINYGAGYVGTGYQGGYWRGNQFEYNTAVNQVNTTVIRNVYNYHITNITVNRVSYNGPGGVQYQPRPAEVMAIREQHTPPMTAQVQIRQQAQTNRAMFYNSNRGRPAIVVAPKPLVADRNVPPPVQVNYARGERPPVPPAIQQRAAAAGRPVTPQGRLAPAAPQAQRPDNRPGAPPQAQRPAQQHAAPNQPVNRPGERPQPAPQQRPESRPAERPQAQRQEAPHPAPEKKPAPEHKTAPERATPKEQTRKPEPEKKKPEDRKPE